MSWQIANGPIPDELQVLHCCDNRPCVNPAHLFLGTNKDNVDDKVKKGRHPVGERAAQYSNPRRGEDQPNSRFKDEQVLEMRRRYSEGESIASIALSFGSKRHVINMIVHGERWAHLPGALPPKRAALHRKEILEMKSAGMTQHAIAVELGFSDAAISRVVNEKMQFVLGKRWRGDTEGGAITV